MSTFILGVSATIVVGMFVWFTIDTIKQLKRIKQLETQRDALWSEIENRCNSIERMLDQMIRDVNSRVDENYSYTDSRLDKMVNMIERDYVTKKNKLDNSIDYNN
jgi:hypothetical protein